MTFGEVLDPFALPVAVAAAALSALWLIWHVARQYAAAPKRVPMRIRVDGRPGRLASKAVLWLAPVAIAAVIVAFGLLLVTAPPRPEQRTLVALAMLALAEAAWFAGWSADRQIEMARKMTYRVAPSRLLRAMLPILVTVVAAVAVAAHP